MWRTINPAIQLPLQPRSETHCTITTGEFFSAASISHGILSPRAALRLCIGTREIKCKSSLAKVFISNRTTFVFSPLEKQFFNNFYWRRLGFEGELMPASCGTRSLVSQSTLFRCFQAPLLWNRKTRFCYTFLRYFPHHVCFYWTWSELACESRARAPSVASQFWVTLCTFHFPSPNGFTRRRLLPSVAVAKSRA